MSEVTLPDTRYFVNLTGQKFFRLVVISYFGTDEKRQHIWKCVCDCGAETTVSAGHLRSGNTKSCGCWKRDAPIALRGKPGRGKSGKRTRTYRIWSGMIKRCTNAKHKSSKNYLLRGISVCNRWRSFDNFLADMGECPDGLSLDRIDNNGNYERINCRWATMKTQARNRRGTRMLTANGVTKSIADWCEELNLPLGRIRQRVLKLGWTAEEALGFAIRIDDESKVALGIRDALIGVWVEIHAQTVREAKWINEELRIIFVDGKERIYRNVPLNKFKRYLENVNDELLLWELIT